MRKRIRWNAERLAKVKLWQEQGVTLNELDIVKSGRVTVSAITNAGHRYFGFGSHQDKISGNIYLTASLSCTRTRQNKGAVTQVDDVIVVVGEPRATVSADNSSDILEAVKILKDKTLSDIIATFVVLNKE